MFQNLQIENFKSIKHIRFNCKKYNLIIGPPNVGKSNILEAISLFSFERTSNNQKVLSEFIRYEKCSNLFYNQDRQHSINIKSNHGEIWLRYLMNSINAYEIYNSQKGDLLDKLNVGQSFSERGRIYNSCVREIERNELCGANPTYYSFDQEGKLLTNGMNSSSNSFVKKYEYKRNVKHTNFFSEYLLPPYGNNLFAVIQNYPEILDNITTYFEKYNLELLLDTENNKLEIQKKIGRKTYKVPYSLCADTLQRLIFHLTAIKSNFNSIILFEEPEAHSYPPYVSTLAEEIINSDSNQFFITTHSPYLLTPFLEHVEEKDLAVFVCSFENYETKIKELSSSEIQEIINRGIDIFYNLYLFDN